MIAHELDNDGIVINTIVVDSLPIPGRNLIEATEGGIGWHWDGETLTPPAPPPLPVPESITYRQFILGLLAASFITQEEALAAASGTIPACINDVFDTLPVEDAVNAKITFKTMTSVLRDDPIVAAAGSSLGQTSDDIDNFFRLASTL